MRQMCHCSFAIAIGRGSGFTPDAIGVSKNSGLSPWPISMAVRSGFTPLAIVVGRPYGFAPFVSQAQVVEHLAAPVRTRRCPYLLPHDLQGQLDPDCGPDKAAGTQLGGGTSGSAEERQTTARMAASSIPSGPHHLSRPGPTPDVGPWQCEHQPLGESERQEDGPGQQRPTLVFAVLMFPHIQQRGGQVSWPQQGAPRDTCGALRPAHAQGAPSGPNAGPDGGAAGPILGLRTKMVQAMNNRQY